VLMGNERQKLYLDDCVGSDGEREEQLSGITGRSERTHMS